MSAPRDNSRKHGYAKNVGGANSFNDYVYDPACAQRKRGYSAKALLVVLAQLNAKDKANGRVFDNVGYKCDSCAHYHSSSSPIRGRLYVRVDANGNAFVR